MSTPRQSNPHKATYLTISTEEYESMKRTIDVLSDKELMEQLRQSRCAKSRPWKKVKIDLGL